MKEKMKSYTDIEQSHKLAEILPLESADMFYRNNGIDVKLMWEHTAQKVTNPCWSLAALLKFIPKHIKNVNVLRIDIDEKDFSIWYDEIGCGVNTELPDITMEDPVDACYELIIKLHELNLL
jgi:hypothetical protein